MRARRPVPLLNIHDGAGDPAAVRAQVAMDGLAPDGSQLHKSAENSRLAAKNEGTLFGSDLEKRFTQNGQ